MDATGKDGTIRQVMSGVNPPGCQVFSFKHPIAAETRPYPNFFRGIGGGQAPHGGKSTTEETMGSGALKEAPEPVAMSPVWGYGARPVIANAKDAF